MEQVIVAHDGNGSNVRATFDLSKVRIAESVSESFADPNQKLLVQLDDYRCFIISKDPSSREHWYFQTSEEDALRRLAQAKKHVPSFLVLRVLGGHEECVMRSEPAAEPHPKVATAMTLIHYCAQALELAMLSFEVLDQIMASGFESHDPLLKWDPRNEIAECYSDLKRTSWCRTTGVDLRTMLAQTGGFQRLRPDKSCPFCAIEFAAGSVWAATQGLSAAIDLITEDANDQPIFSLVHAKLHSQLSQIEAILPGFDAQEFIFIPTTTCEHMETRHSPDFTYVYWFGTEYHFALGAQANSVRLLYQAWKDRTLNVSSATIAEATESAAGKFNLSHVFAPQERQVDGTRRRKPHPAWRTMIQSVSRGVYRLVEPDSSTLSKKT